MNLNLDIGHILFVGRNKNMGRTNKIEGNKHDSY